MKNNAQLNKQIQLLNQNVLQKHSSLEERLSQLEQNNSLSSMPSTPSTQVVESTPIKVDTQPQASTVESSTIITPSYLTRIIYFIKSKSKLILDSIRNYS